MLVRSFFFSFYRIVVFQGLTPADLPAEFMINHFFFQQCKIRYSKYSFAPGQPLPFESFTLLKIHHVVLMIGKFCI